MDLKLLELFGIRECFGSIFLVNDGLDMRDGARFNACEIKISTDLANSCRTFLNLLTFLQIRLPRKRVIKF
jgi:hypothetical protein